MLYKLFNGYLKIKLTSDVFFGLLWLRMNSSLCLVYYHALKPFHLLWRLKFCFCFFFSHMCLLDLSYINSFWYLLSYTALFHHWQFNTFLRSTIHENDLKINPKYLPTFITTEYCLKWSTISACQCRRSKRQESNCAHNEHNESVMPLSPHWCWLLILVNFWDCRLFLYCPRTLLCLQI